MAAGFDPRSYHIGQTGERRHSAPAAVRNRDPITQVLAQELPDHGLVLEIASGTGEHAAHFAQHFTQLDWQPSDPVQDALTSIAAWQDHVGLPNLRPPVMLDAARGDWPVDHAAAMLCINMVHISPWTASEGLFAAAGRILPRGGPLILYGPYFEDGVAAAPSNLAFDASLKHRNPEWGIRRIEDLDMLAGRAGLYRAGRVEMPANNLMLIYRKL